MKKLKKLIYPLLNNMIMSRFWKINFCINVILIILFIMFLYWDIQVKKGNSGLIFYLFILCCGHFLFQILSFIIRLITKKNNQYAFAVIFVSFLFIIAQFGVLVFIMSHIG